MMAGAMQAAAEDGRSCWSTGSSPRPPPPRPWRARRISARRMVFCHRSHEAGHRALLDWLGADPLLDLDMRLGEGTGALLAWPLVKAASAMLCDMASFDSAGVSQG